MKKLLVTAVALTFCGSCLAAGKQSKAEQGIIAQGKQEVAEMLKDPESARFRNVRTTQDGAFLCGEVNARNGFGGYAGFKRFYGIPGHGGARLEGTEEFVEETYQRLCMKG